MGISRKSITIISVIGITVFIIWVLLPIIHVLQQSVKPQLYMFTSPPSFIFPPTGEHFQRILERDASHFMVNSLIVAAGSTFLCLFLGSMCAYSLSSLKIPGRHFWAILVLFTRMVPASTLMIPIYTIMRELGLLNTHVALIITHATLNLPFTIWMMRSFFSDLPFELEQAAMIDGCSRFKSFLRIALPLSAPGLVATGILTAIYSWNELLFSLILTGVGTRTMPVWISGFVSQVSVDWGGSSAAAVISFIPIFIAGIAVQKYLVRGLTMGAVKG